MKKTIIKWAVLVFVALAILVGLFLWIGPKGALYLAAGILIGNFLPFKKVIPAIPPALKWLGEVIEKAIDFFAPTPKDSAEPQKPQGP